VLHLPPTIDKVLRALLEEFLGKDDGTRIYQYIMSSPLSKAIRSGYDVRLLADLIERGVDPDELPKDRVGLYELILDSVSLSDGQVYPEDRLCRAAWELWREGERQLVPDEDLPRHLVEPLWREETKVLRALDGEGFEFRHDQMRGYLAARWAVIHTVAPIHLFEEDKAVWRLGRSDQEVVWGFAAAMMNYDQGLTMWRWAMQAPERTLLQHAVQQQAKREGWLLYVE
jgi:hypothetical protein